MARPAQHPIPDHPLLDDRGRLDRILNVMYAEIQKVIHRGTQPQRREAARAGRGTERAVVGGESVDDVLQEALLALLSYEPARLTSSWEALAVGIAQKKALGAIRKATKGRRRTRTEDGEAQPEINVVSLSGTGADDDPLGELTSGDDDLDAEFVRTEQQLILRDLARELLDDRERRIFYDVHFFDIPRAEVGRSLGGLSGQRVGQIYTAVLQRLLLAAHSNPMFRRVSDYPDRTEGGPDDQLR